MLYLRRLRGKNGYEYIIRESSRCESGWTHRDLVHLGGDPCEFIHYPGGNGYYIDLEVEDALERAGVDYAAEELEDVFLPFLDPHIRRIIENFRNDSRVKSRWSCCPDEELLRRQEQLHSFDKRRLHFLRCGRIDIGKLDGRPWKFLNVLLEKSRDEIEHVIEGMERELPPREIRSYLYTAFHIQAYFPGHLLRNHPVGLAPEKVDGYFLEELCCLNEDSRFFKGVDFRIAGRLHPYLEKYVILYFDNDFDTGNVWDQYVRDFVGRRQFHKPPVSGPSMAVQDALLILDIQGGQFSDMSREDLVRCYRRKAKTIHPDRGGDHDAFVRLAEAYECLLACK